MILEGRWVFDGHSCRIRLEDGYCRSVELMDRAATFRIAPGMVDLQVNGYMGVDYSSPELTVEQVEQACRHLVSCGTTRHLATIITRPRKVIEDNLRTIARARKLSPLVAAAIVGVHVEGPFISPVDGPRGVHNLDDVRAASVEEFDSWQRCAPGLVRMVTLAAEQQNACAFIRHITTQGVIASLGHSDASPQEFEAAVAAGARMGTHFGNGTKRTLPRFHNVLWWQLGTDQVCPSIIADGFHVDPLVVKVVARAKGREALVLVSDVCPLAGLPPGYYSWDQNQLRLHPDGHITRKEDGRLAGAGFLLDWCVPHFRRFTGCTLARAYYAASVLPARMLGFPSEWGRPPQPGTPADFILFREQDDSLQVVDGFLEGKRLPEACPAPTSTHD